MRKHLPTLAQSLAACLHLADRFPSFISSAMTGTRSTEGAKNMNWEFTCIHMHTMNANFLFSLQFLPWKFLVHMTPEVSMKLYPLFGFYCNPIDIFNTDTFRETGNPPKLNYTISKADEEPIVSQLLQCLLCST